MSGQSTGNGARKCKIKKIKLWRNDDLKKLEEDMPRLKESDMAQAAKTCKAKTGVGCDGFHPKVPLFFDTRNKRRSGGVLGEGGTVWEMAEQAWTAMFFLIPMNVTCERPIALTLTMICW